MLGDIVFPTEKFFFLWQVPSTCALHWYRHPSWRWCAGSFLLDRPCHDSIFSQIWELLFPWYRYKIFYCSFSVFKNQNSISQLINMWKNLKFYVTFIENECFLICTPIWILHWHVGDMYEVGAESGRYYCLNVPLRDGIDDQSESSTGACWIIHLQCIF